MEPDLGTTARRETGRNEPIGKLAVQSPCLNFSEASRYAATKLRVGLPEFFSRGLWLPVAAWNPGLGDFFVLLATCGEASKSQ